MRSDCLVASQNWRLSLDAATADVLIAFDDSTIIDLVDGELTLNDAISQERIRMFGSVDGVAKFNEALFAYLEGLILATGTPELLRRYRA